jgi:hypothetical protein
LEHLVLVRAIHEVQTRSDVGCCKASQYELPRPIPHGADHLQSPLVTNFKVNALPLVEAP